MFSQKVQILRSNFDVYKVIESKLANAQEEAFMVCDLGDIIRKYQNWRQKLPRITPYYGKYELNNFFLISFLKIDSFPYSGKMQ